MSKHTPGPWKVVTNGNPLCSGIVAVIEHSPERILAVEEDHYGGPWCAPDTWDANARLIAAAPDLLAACVDAEEECRAELSRGPLLGYGHNGPHQQLWTLLGDKLRAAIKKAEGK